MAGLQGSEGSPARAFEERGRLLLKEVQSGDPAVARLDGFDTAGADGIAESLTIALHWN